MTRVKPYQLPTIRRFSDFAELNVRTYVTFGGKPGVWFFSLDAANSWAVTVARSLFHLPYFNARMSLSERDDVIEYQSARTHRGAPSACFTARYRPVGSSYLSSSDTLEAWLTERYCLYAGDRRQRLWRTDIHHQQWPLQPAKVEVAVNTMTDSIGIDLSRTEPLLHFARKLDVIAWKPELVFAP